MVDTSTEAVTKLLDGVTPGPWGAEYDDYGEEIWFGGEGCGTWTVGPCFIGGDGHDPDLARIMDADARFIAAARDLVPALLADRDALRAEVERLKAKPEPIREITDADMANIVAHLSYECEPKGPLPNANSLMMEVVRLRNAIAEGRE